MATSDKRPQPAFGRPNESSLNVVSPPLSSHLWQVAMASFWPSQREFSHGSVTSIKQPPLTSDHSQLLAIPTRVLPLECHLYYVATSNKQPQPAFGRPNDSSLIVVSPLLSGHLWEVAAASFWPSQWEFYHCSITSIKRLPLTSGRSQFLAVPTRVLPL